MSKKRFLRISSLSILCALGSIAPALAAGWDTVPLGGGGYVTGLVSNANGSSIYCRTDVGGAFRWVPAVDGTNGSWVSLTDAMVPFGTSNASELMKVEGIGVDPSYLNRVYVGAGNGIWGSDDRGVTWYQIRSGLTTAGNGDGKLRGERLAVDPNNSNIVWYGSVANGLQKGVLTSGTWAWSQIPTTSVPLGSANIGVSFVACDKNGTSTITYAGVSGSNGGIFRSLDSGSTWSIVPGVAFISPRRAQVASNGTVYITGGTTGVAKLTRSGTLSLLSTLPTGINYNGVAVDPNDVSGNTVFVADIASIKIWRSPDGGQNWTLQSSYNATRMEPDGTLAKVGYWFGNTSSLLVNPANSNNLLLGDFFGVSATYNANLLGSGTASTWYTLQKNQEETCVFALKTPHTGTTKLLTGLGDVGGAWYEDITARPTSMTSGNGNITSLDFCENNPNFWARGWVESDGSGGGGAFSINGGSAWTGFGQLHSRKVTNSSTAGWETFDIGPYLKQQKAANINIVTLVVKSSSSETNQACLEFSSKEGAYAPHVLVDGTATLVTTADAFVSKSGTSSNYGQYTKLLAQNYYDQANYTRVIFLKFDLSSVSSITSGTLRLYRLTSTDTHSYSTSVYSTPTTSWIEGDGGSDNLPAGELTWNNMPTNLYAPPVAVATGTSGGGGRVAVSATDPALMVWVPIGIGTPAYYTKNRGVTWTASTGGPGSQISGVYTNGNSQDISGQCLAADRANGNFYLANFGGTGHSIYRSTNNGATWTKVATVSNGNSYNMRTPQLVAAPVSATCPAGGDVWLCDDNTYNNNVGGGGLWRSITSGTSWSKISAIDKATAVTFGKSSNGIGYAVYIYGYKAGVKGVYRSDDYGSNWTKLADPSIGIFGALEGDRQNYNSVFLGTSGRGTFRYNAGPTTILLSDSADAYVRDGSYANTNYGADALLAVKKDATSYARHTYLTFDLTQCSSNITSGTLKLCTSSTSGASATPIAVYPCTTTNWIESGTGGITWNNKPATTGSALDTVTVPASTLPGTWVSWDVGSYLQQQKSAGNNMVTLILQGTVVGSNNWVNFSSDETGANTPQISVTYQ